MNKRLPITIKFKNYQTAQQPTSEDMMISFTENGKEEEQSPEVLFWL